MIKGSGKQAYEVYLENCTCMDFMRRKLPCKHMYRLAHELGVFRLHATPRTAKVVPHSTIGDVDIYVNLDNGEAYERARFREKENLDNLDKLKLKLADLSYDEIVCISRNLPTSNSAYNAPWLLASTDSNAVRLLVDIGLFSIVDVSAAEALQHLSREQIFEVLEIVDPKQTINRKSITKTWIKRITAEFREDLEGMSDKIFLLEALPSIGWRYGTIYNYIKKLRIKTVLCDECYKVWTDMRMGDVDDVVNSTDARYCYMCKNLK